MPGTVISYFIGDFLGWQKLAGGGGSASPSVVNVRVRTQLAVLELSADIPAILSVISPLENSPVILVAPSEVFNSCRLTTSRAATGFYVPNLPLLDRNCTSNGRLFLIT